MKKVIIFYGKGKVVLNDLSQEFHGFQLSDKKPGDVILKNSDYGTLHLVNYDLKNGELKLKSYTD